jgi:hypothetical protein
MVPSVGAYRWDPGLVGEMAGGRRGHRNVDDPRVVVVILGLDPFHRQAELPDDSMGKIDMEPA